MGGWLYTDEPGGLLAFLFFVVALGGLGGIATGRAFAGTWRSPLFMIPAILVLAAAVRFLLYALASEDLLSPAYYAVALAVVALGCAYGFRSRRADQMCRQYPWIFDKSGPLGWAERG